MSNQYPDFKVEFIASYLTDDEKAYYLALRVAEMMHNLSEQGFLEEWTNLMYEANWKFPISLGHYNLFLIEIAKGEACKILLREGLD